MIAADLHLTCRHCREVLFALSLHLGDEVLRMLRDHIHQVHPHVALPADAAAGAILAHLDVDRTMTAGFAGMILGGFRCICRAVEAALKAVGDWLADALLVIVLVVGCVVSIIVLLHVPSLLVALVVMAIMLWCED